MDPRSSSLVLLALCLATFPMAQATIYVIAPDGSGDFATIQEAIAFATADDIIELTDGTFTGPGNRDLDLLGKQITVRSQSGDPEACIIDCDGSAATPHRGITCGTSEGALTRVEGITIRNGWVAGDEPATSGGGIRCLEASPTLHNLILENNASGEDGGGSGGGMYCTGCTSTLTEIVFQSNTAGGYSATGSGGGLYCFNSTLTLEQVSFLNNVTGGYYGSGYGGGLYAASSSVTIIGAEFSDNTAGGSDYVSGAGGGLYASTSTVEVDQARFEGNFARDAGGGMYVTSCDLRVGHSQLVSNTAGFPSGAGGGFYEGNPTATLLEYVTFADNYAYEGGGMTCSGDAVLSYCTFYANYCAFEAPGAAMSCYSDPQIDHTIFAFQLGEPVVGGAPALSCCDVYGNLYGDYVGPLAGQEGVNFNISADPIFCRSLLEVEGYYLEAESPCAAENSPDGGQIGAWPIGCEVIFVNPDGSGDYATIQEAVDAAGDGAVVFLGNGTYVGEGNTDVNFRGRAIILRTQTRGRSSVVIDCQGLRRGFTFNTGEGPGSVIDGITVINGVAPYGGAVFCSTGTSPTLMNCTFEADSAGFEGGAIACWGDASPTITNCVFRSNRAPYGAGLCCDDEAAAQVTHCEFIANRAGNVGGGAYCAYESQPVFEYCTFVEDSALAGGAIYCEPDAAPTLRHCTLALNDAPAGGGISASGGLPILENVIIAFSTHGAAVAGGGSISLSCCDLYGNAGGDWTGAIASQLGANSNISMDPEFCNPGLGDFHLWNYSPCNQTACGLIGAWSLGCEDPAGVRPDRSDERPSPRLLPAAIRPSPASGPVRIAYELPAGIGPSAVRLQVLDVTGRAVRTLVNGPQSAGTHVLQWTTEGDDGQRLPCGLYFCRLSCGGQRVVSRVMLVR
ncbi:MAG: hypothetical protein KAY32_16760 [Candidatus Eisenbacteria sp.]|nr:hypothetical protein [Candidatus Eisenbacteria bacterium]